MAYGKFFHKKAGFISKEWFPYFANYRRDGYDFDAKWEDGLANMRCKKIMDEFESQEEWMSHELKKQAGFYKGGEKNFSGMITEHQMQTYLITRDFRQKRNKKGVEYGMAVSVYMTPEELWGYDLVTSAYKVAFDCIYQGQMKNSLLQAIFQKADIPSAWCWQNTGLAPCGGEIWNTCSSALRYKPCAAV